MILTSSSMMNTPSSHHLHCWLPNPTCHPLWIIYLLLVIINSIKPISLKQHKFTVWQLCSSKVLKSKCWKGCIPHRGFKGELFSLSFLAFRGNYAPWIMDPFSIFKVSIMASSGIFLSDLCFYCCIAFSHSDTPASLL